MKGSDNVSSTESARERHRKDKPKSICPGERLRLRTEPRGSVFLAMERSRFRKQFAGERVSGEPGVWLAACTCAFSHRKHPEPVQTETHASPACGDLSPALSYSLLFCSP